MQFQLNSYSVLLLLPFVHGFLFCGLLFRRYYLQHKLSDVLLSFLILILVITISFWMLGFAGWYDSHDGYTMFMFYFPFQLFIFVGPLLYFYFLSLTNTEFRFSIKHWPHAILPIALFGLVVFKLVVDFGFYYPFPTTEEYQYGTKGPYAELDKSLIVSLISFISIFGYLGLTLSGFRKYRQYIQNNFSELDSIRFTWLLRLQWSVGIGILFFFLFFLIGQFTDVMSYKLNWYAYLGIGIVIYYISIHGYGQQVTQINRLKFQPQEEVPITIEPNHQQIPEGWEEWETKFKQLIEQQHPHLNPELSLSELARLMGTHPQTVSRMINIGFGQNFNDCINALRVREVQAKIKAGEHQRHTLISLALDCGFNSKATFNRAFKKHTSLTPKEWMDQNSVTDSPQNAD